MKTRKNPARDCVDLIKQQDPEKQMKQIVKALKEAEEQGKTGRSINDFSRCSNNCVRRPGQAHSRPVGSADGPD